jgi:hypothetical protein
VALVADPRSLTRVAGINEEVVATPVRVLVPPIVRFLIFATAYINNDCPPPQRRLDRATGSRREDRDVVTAEQSAFEDSLLYRDGRRQM